MATLLEAVQEYLGPESSWDDESVQSALSAEKAAQAQSCVVPAATVVTAEEWPADLLEALCRRVAHNLQLRGLPLGLQPLISEAAVANTRVGGEDAEVRRLEGPHKPVVFG